VDFQIKKLKFKPGVEKMETIKFKFKHLDDNGNETGFLSQKGWFDGETLMFGKDPVDASAVLRVQKRIDRLFFSLVQEDGEVIVVGMTIKSGPIDELMNTINSASSQFWFEVREREIYKSKNNIRIRIETCPDCKSLIDLTAKPETPQVYCQYCTSIITTQGKGSDDEHELDICDECGYYSNPKVFTTFYFYFLLFIYGWQSSKRQICHACMRPLAWKMFFVNFIFLLGLPIAVWQLVRSYKGGTSNSFSGLDQANNLARKGKLEDALVIYKNIHDSIGNGAGIYYNMGKACEEQNKIEKAIKLYELSLNDCANYEPSYLQLRYLYESNNDIEKLEALEKIWV
jgi:hypothetical protein